MGVSSVLEDIASASHAERLQISASASAGDTIWAKQSDQDRTPGVHRSPTPFHKPVWPRYVNPEDLSTTSDPPLGRRDTSVNRSRGCDCAARISNKKYTEPRKYSSFDCLPLADTSFCLT
mmetsp:Transcript_2410/g.6999  ORF Transcript_2410/g.6999 Transcript_2410/m.6999 type:complete len:120 (+) Transcript_2410:990-1349(+)